mmetsp:Transcript_27398/g.51291  ORF Transcript_27398/g.51291 Transcript_27398/m.51291 type:complete len:198 (+) Transcript_27398:1-594(+)
MDLHLRPRMLTGDAESAAKHLSAAVGLDPSQSLFSMTPEEKLGWVEMQQGAGRRTLMLGDGINDATALAEAFVGVAVGDTGASLATYSADVVMMTDRLHKISQCIRMCKYAVRIEHINIALPCAIKILQGILVLMGELDLWMAVGADLGTLLAVLVLGVSILSRRFWVDIDEHHELGSLQDNADNRVPRHPGSDEIV